MSGVATIPSGTPFVDALAAGLLAEAGDNRLALSDMLVHEGRMIGVGKRGVVDLGVIP